MESAIVIHTGGELGTVGGLVSLLENCCVGCLNSATRWCNWGYGLSVGIGSCVRYFYVPSWKQPRSGGVVVKQWSPAAAKKFSNVAAGRGRKR